MTDIAFEKLGLAKEAAPYLVLWAHGWGMDRNAFRPFAETLAPRAAHILIDFPGFGQSPLPPPNWTTADYADAMAAFIRPYRQAKKIIWVGHSFGCRVGIQLATRHGDLVDGLFLLAGAGLPRRRSLIQRLSYAIRIYTFKTLKHLAPLLGMDVEKLRSKFGSADYKNAGPMRAVFLNVIREDLSEQARQIKAPTQLVYGAADTETPPDIGERLNRLISQSALTILPDQDHYSVLGAGRHIVIKRLADFMEKIR